MSLEEEIKKLTNAILMLNETINKNENPKKEKENENKSRLIKASKWNQYHDWPPVAGLRHLIFNAKTNGIGCCIKKVGKTVLIIEDEFLKWAKNHPGVQ